jgi:hypothetical protein
MSFAFNRGARLTVLAMPQLHMGNFCPLAREGFAIIRIVSRHVSQQTARQEHEKNCLEPMPNPLQSPIHD